VLFSRFLFTIYGHPFIRPVNIQFSERYFVVKLVFSSLLCRFFSVGKTGLSEKTGLAYRCRLLVADWLLPNTNCSSSFQSPPISINPHPYSPQSPTAPFPPPVLFWNRPGICRFYKNTRKKEGEILKVE
jgi:hypothetical protein